ncbi:MAG TPA: tetratricopeptide repeat protein [Dehalococcoidales bacterium]|nr:tetratricopeptide repeat protein [Dehalococcoidales bacterium]
MENSIPNELLTLWDEARENIEQRQFNRAIEIYRYILLMYSEDKVAVEFAHAYLADVYLTLRNTDLAKAHIRKALKMAPRVGQYHYILGFIYSLEIQWQKSMREFERALQASPEKAEFLRGLGWATYNAGEKERGILILNKALYRQPDDINILTDLAVCYLGLLAFRKARKYVGLALKVDPANSLAKSTLWMVDYAEHQAHMEEDHWSDNPQ